MLRRRISAVIALVIYFLSTSLIIVDCRRLDGGTEDSTGENGGIPNPYYNSSLAATATSFPAQVKYRIHPMNHHRHQQQ